MSRVLLILRTFAVSADAKKVDYTEEEEEDGNPNTNVDIISPERDGDTGSGDFEWQDRQPPNRIVPSHSKAPVLYIITLLLIIFAMFRCIPCFVDKPATVCEESAIDRVEDSKFSQSLHGEQQHSTNNDESEKLVDRAWSACTASPHHDCGPWERRGDSIITYNAGRSTIIER